MRLSVFATNLPSPQGADAFGNASSLVRQARTPRHRGILISLCLSVLVAMILTAKTSLAQTPAKKLREFTVVDVNSVSLDRLGNLYLVSGKGTIKKYDPDGNFMSEFSNPESIPVTLLEPWNPLRVFVYSQEQQQILILDRLMTQQEKIPVEPSLAVKPILASPTPNANFWLLDGADFSLKKIDSKSTKVLQEMNLKISPGTKPDFTFLREYQNLLFLIDQQSGVQILSVTGKVIRSLPIKALKHLGFIGPEIYYLENGKIKLFDFYSEEQHELQADPLAKFVLLTDERMVVVKKATVEVWEYTP